MQQIRVLVVDDSAFLRRNLPAILETDREIKVVATAADGQEALSLVKKLRPDVVTLDVIMPVMDGLTALKCIMEEAPTPVVMVSSVTYEGARQTIEALSLGAVDYILKPSGPTSLDVAKIRKELIAKVRLAYEGRFKIGGSGSIAKEKFKRIVSDLSVSAPTHEPPLYAKRGPNHKWELLAVAASTGGPSALQVLLRDLPADLPVGVVIVQHIAEGFSEALAERLDEASPLEIKVCGNFEPIRPGLGLLAPSGRHLTLRRVDGRLYAVLSKEPARTLHRPSADVTFSSVARICGPGACAVILTGMGADGAEGMKEIRELGGLTIAQDEATSLIYGMPKAAMERGGAEIVTALEKIASEIRGLFLTRSRDFA